jgi:glyoxylase-like metal-dependent hydrolase (beta-lactamase superfamily II)
VRVARPSLTAAAAALAMSAAALMVWSVHANDAQPSQTGAAERIRSQSLAVSDNLYLAVGAGSNSLVMGADSGIVIVDAKRAGSGQVLAEIGSAVSDQPVTTVILTTADDDHVGGLADLPAVKQIVAHDNTKAALQKKAAFQGAGARMLPSTTFADHLALLDGRDRVELYYFGPAHTNGDIVVVFPGKRVALVGDLFPDKRAPSIDVANGGSGVQFPATLAKAVAALKDIPRIIPGHAVSPTGSPLGRWITLADFQEYADFNREFLSAVQEAIKSGKTAEEAAASLTLPERYKAYGMENVRANVQAIYQEIDKR